MLQDSSTKTGRVPRTFRLNGAKEFVGSEMRDFYRKHNITLRLVPTYNHMLQCRVEGANRINAACEGVQQSTSNCNAFWMQTHS